MVSVDTITALHSSVRPSALCPPLLEGFAERPGSRRLFGLGKHRRETRQSRRSLRLMQRVRLRDRDVADFGSRGVTAWPHARLGAVEGAAVDVLTFEAGAVLGRHPTRLWQLFSVVHGAGWASGADGVRVPVVARDCVLWEPHEEHESGSDEGMVVVIVQTPSPPLPDIV